MTNKELRKIDEEINQEMKSGKYPVVHSDIISKMMNIQFCERLIDENDRVLETYYEYLSKLESMPKAELKRVLKLFKGADIIDNQTLRRFLSNQRIYANAKRPCY